MPDDRNGATVTHPQPRPAGDEPAGQKDDTMKEIESKLDQLAEFYSQKDSIEAQKRALMDENKVPAEVLAVNQRANEEAQAFASAQNKKAEAIRAECAAKLKEIVIPDEVKAVIEKIDSERRLVMAYQEAKEREIMQAAEQKRAELFAQSQAQTAQVYADIEQRKREIAEEFAGKEQDAAANIAKLESEIKDDVKKRAAKKLEEDLDADDLSVKSALYHAVYSRGRITWEAKRLDKLPKKLAEATAEIDSFVAMTEELSSLRKRISDIAWILSDARKEGEPSVALRKI